MWYESESIFLIIIMHAKIEDCYQSMSCGDIKLLSLQYFILCDDVTQKFIIKCLKICQFLALFVIH